MPKLEVLSISLVASFNFQSTRTVTWKSWCPAGSAAIRNFRLGVSEILMLSAIVQCIATTHSSENFLTKCLHLISTINSF